MINKIVSTIYQGLIVRNIVLLFLIGLTNLSANDWIQMNPSTNPSDRLGTDLAYIGGDKILLYGGSNNAEDTWVYDMSDNTWIQKSPSSNPTARYNHAMAFIGDDKVLLFGGQYPGGTFHGETWIYDLSDDSWTQQDPTVSWPGHTQIVTGRQWHDLSYIGDDKVILYGGYDFSINGETWIYDLSDNTWTHKNTSGSPGDRYRHKICYLGGDQVLFFGGCYTECFDDTWVYDLVPTLGPKRILANQVDH